MVLFDKLFWSPLTFGGFRESSLRFAMIRTFIFLLRFAQVRNDWRRSAKVRHGSLRFLEIR